MSADEFNHNRLALISNKLIKFTTLSDESDYYWDKIANKWYDFDIRVKEAHALEELSQEDVIVRRRPAALGPSGRPLRSLSASAHQLETRVNPALVLGSGSLGWLSCLRAVPSSVAPPEGAVKCPVAHARGGALRGPQSWYAEHLAPSSRKRSKLSVQVTGKNHAGSAGGEEAAGVEAVPPVLVSSLDEMKKGLALFPALHRSPAA